jgi:hypothetical protein
MVAPNTLLGVEVPQVEPKNLVVIIDTLLGLDASIEVQIVLVNMKTMANKLGVGSPHVQDSISH